MDLVKMAKAQAELDKVICKKANIKKPKLKDLQLALMIELGEMLNEEGSFKYWKTSHKVKKDKLIDEWADTMHFALSIMNNTGGFTKEDAKMWKELADIFSQHNTIAKLYKSIIREITISSNFIIAYLLAMGTILGFTEEELEQAYYTKREINFKRVYGGY